MSLFNRILDRAVEDRWAKFVAEETLRDYAPSLYNKLMRATKADEIVHLATRFLIDENQMNRVYSLAATDGFENQGHPYKILQRTLHAVVVYTTSSEEA